MVGLVAGVFGGLVGLGGGAVMVPMMVSFMGMSQHKAVGTSLVAVFFTAIAGAFAYGSQRSIDWKAAIIIALSAIALARFGAKFAGSLPDWKLKRFFGYYLIVASALLLIKPYLPALGWASVGLGKLVVLLVSGATAGFFSGLLGVGGGTMMVPGMVLLAGFSQLLAQGTSLVAMVPSSMVGSYVHNQMGNVDRRNLPMLVPGVLIGGTVGGYLAHFLGDNSLRVMFAVVLLWTASRYLGAKPKVASR